MLILSGSLSAGLKRTLTRMAETSELRNASALARRLEPEFPLAVDGVDRRAASGRRVPRHLRRRHLGLRPRGRAARVGLRRRPRERRARRSAAGRGSTEAPRTRHGPASGRLGRRGQAARGPTAKPRGRRRDGELASTSRLAILRRGPRPALGHVLGLARRRRAAGLRVLGAHRQAHPRDVRRGRGDRRRATSSSGCRPASSPTRSRTSPTRTTRMAATLGEAFGAIQESRAPDRRRRRVDGRGRRRLRLRQASCASSTPRRCGCSAAPAATCVGTAVDEITAEPTVLDVVRAGLAGESAARDGVARRSSSCCCTARRCSTPTGRVRRRGAAARGRDRAAPHRGRAAPLRRRREPRDAHADRGAQGHARAAGRRSEGRARGARRLHPHDAGRGRTGWAGSSPTCSRSLSSRRAACGSSQHRSPSPTCSATSRASCSTLAEQAGVTLSVEVARRGRRVLADRDRIVQVLLELHRQRAEALAVPARPCTCAPRRGRLRCASRSPTRARASSPRRSRASSSASTAPTRRARAARGAGLGLAIAKEIVEAHGSSIDVHSARVRGRPSLRAPPALTSHRLGEPRRESRSQNPNKTATAREPAPARSGR